jgi:hypothetical protein
MYVYDTWHRERGVNACVIEIGSLSIPIYHIHTYTYTYTYTYTISIPVEHPALQQFLIRHAHFDGVVVGTVLLEPLVNKWHIVCPAGKSGPFVKGSGSPVQRDAKGGVVSVEGLFVQDGVEVLGQGEVLVVQAVCMGVYGGV